MIIVFPDINTNITCSDGEINTLVIESPTRYREIVKELINQINGDGGKIELFDEKYKSLHVSKNIEMLMHFSSIDMNKKSLISGLQSRIEKEVISPIWWNDTQKILSSLEKLIYDVTNDMPCQIVLEKLSLSNIVKAIGIMLETKSNIDIEIIFNYIRIFRDIIGDKLFVFVGLRDFFEDREIDSFFKMVKDYGFKVLFVERHSYYKFEYERRIIVDNDLCLI